MVKRKRVNYRKTAAFLMVVLKASVLTRLVLILLFSLGANSAFGRKIINDSWHHYQLGLLLLFLSRWKRFKHQAGVMAGIGLGMILEEGPIILYDLGALKVNHYLSRFDFAYVAIPLALVYLLSSVLAKKSTQESLSAPGGI